MFSIDKITCLCIEDRFQEWLDLEGQLNKLGLYDKYERFLAGSEDSNHSHKPDRTDIPKDQIPNLDKWGYGRPEFKHRHWNAFHCHKEMLMRAKNEQCRNVLFLEDDAYFLDRYEYVMDNLQRNINDDDFDLLYLGWWIGDENDDWNKKVETDFENDGIIKIGKVRQIGGLHGVIINHHMFDSLITMMPNNPIDYQLNINFHSKIMSFYVQPKMIHIRSTFSYCEDTMINRLPLQ